MPVLRLDLPLSEVLTDLQRIGSHLGQVQEGGRTVGVIALEDVVEAFVGEVEDASHLDAEHDPRPGHEHDPRSDAVTAQEGDTTREQTAPPEETGMRAETRTGSDEHDRNRTHEDELRHRRSGLDHG
jgi:hypothetical protein